MPQCAEGISDASAHRLSDSLRTLDADCKLSSVHTEYTRTLVKWEKDGQSIEPVVVVPSACVRDVTTRGTVLSLVVPRAAFEACPKSVAALQTLIETSGSGAGDDHR
jgi:hypothetical protein